MYLHTQHAFGKLKTPSAPGTISMMQYRDNLAVMVTSLERSSALQLTGIPVNASRVCENRIKIGPKKETGQDASEQIADSWLSYVRLLRVFLNSVEVEE
jgi:hypothetical protein